MHINKTDLIQKVAKETRVPQRIVNDVLTESLAAITEALRRGEEVALLRFSTFSTRERPAGTVRNFKTGEVMTVPALHQAVFRPGEVLRRAVRRQLARRRRTSSKGG